MVMGGRHYVDGVRIVTGPHLGSDKIKAWRVVDGHTHCLSTEEARHFLFDHLNSDTPACGCISSYPRPPWHDAEDHGCMPVDVGGHWNMTWRFRKEGIVSGNPTDPRQIQHVIEHTLNWELAKLPNTLEGEDLETAQQLLIRARANLEAAIALITTGIRDRDYEEEIKYPNDRAE